MTELELAKAVSTEADGGCLSQSWISRICKGEFKRATPRVRRVAKFAKIRIYESTSASEAGKKLIMNAVHRSWNGSISHASMLARIIVAARTVRGDLDSE